MTFRNFLLDNLINNEFKLFSFQIGCYPSSTDSYDHEYPQILTKYKKKIPELKIYRILIDKFYQDNIEFPLDKNNTYIYPYCINEEDYNTIIEFSHFMKNFNTISISNTKKTKRIKRSW